MNFQQLKIIREAARRRFNLTEVGAALFTSQSGVSKHIKDLEDELGIEIFLRKGKRILGLTPPGEQLLTMVEHILRETQNIKSLAEHYRANDQGRLVIATTHTQARYVLPRIIGQFTREFPKVHLALHQGAPDEIAQHLIHSRADIAIATESLAEHEELVSFPFYQWRHIVIAPKAHPLNRLRKKISLTTLANYPLISYHQGFTGRAHVDLAFAQAGLAPKFVLSALDADVIKTYVDINLGLGIIAQMAFDGKRDGGLIAVPHSEGLFPTNTTRIAVRRGHFLREYAYRFLSLCSSDLTEERIRKEATPDAD